MRLPDLPEGLTARDGRPLGGGSICDVWRVELTDGRAAVLKRTPYPAGVEADGLAALAAAGAPVPAVLGVGDDVLVLEEVGAGPPGEAEWRDLGRALAGMHADTGEAYGWHRDNLIGSLPQANDPDDDWPRFYAERRLRPWLGATALPKELRRRLERALDGPLQDLLATGNPPSLVHGDLWNGNVVDGRWLIDPAVHRADREFELAFADLFGGFPPAFHEGYAETWPLPEGWQRRRPALQLYHLLVHVELFGAGFAGAVGSRLDALGW
ncbi:fructosamine kinase family protein [Egibacter rhizosphaerae]|nr:fructosamine kinase family protein [Egibacter rhizosphaerae]